MKPVKEQADGVVSQDAVTEIPAQGSHAANGNGHHANGNGNGNGNGHHANGNGNGIAGGRFRDGNGRGRFQRDGRFPASPERSRSDRKLLRPLGIASDEELVAEVRRGNERAFDVIHRRYVPPLLSFIRHTVGSQEDAEDALQQTLYKAFRSMRDSDNELQLKPWLYTIARNECITIFRQRSTAPAEEYDEEMGPSTIGLAEQVEQREELRDTLSAISKLPNEQRQALLLTSLGTLSGDEIGRVLGCDRAKVKSLVFRARTSLAKVQEARDTSCEEIREQLSELHGGALRRKVLREHVMECEGCREFQHAVRRQRRLVAAILPVSPLGFAKAAGLLGALGGGGAVAGGGGVATGGAVGSAALAGSGFGVGAAGVVVAAALSIATFTQGGGDAPRGDRGPQGREAVEMSSGFQEREYVASRGLEPYSPRTAGARKKNRASDRARNAARKRDRTGQRRRGAVGKRGAGGSRSSSEASDRTSGSTRSSQPSVSVSGASYVDSPGNSGANTSRASGSAGAGGSSKGGGNPSGSSGSSGASSAEQGSAKQGTSRGGRPEHAGGSSNGRGGGRRDHAGGPSDSSRASGSSGSGSGKSGSSRGGPPGHAGGSSRGPKH